MILYDTNFISNLSNMRSHDSVHSAMQHEERQWKHQAKYEVTGTFIIKCEQIVDRNAMPLSWIERSYHH